HAVLRILNERRAARSLPPIPFSSKLTKVAEVHAQNQDAAKVPLTHDWHGEYACSMADSGVCMWDKPRRIAGYEDAGYECGYGGGTDDPKSLVDSWEGSPMHAQVLFNEGMWNQPWEAAGAGRSGNYGFMWFGNLKDDSPSGTPEEIHP
ncbi:hypothetical protein K502DRAFT_347259, partial [Neoconidiobolus thromboides FSU 785]